LVAPVVASLVPVGAAYEFEPFDPQAATTSNPAPSPGKRRAWRRFMDVDRAPTMTTAPGRSLGADCEFPVSVAR